MKRPQNSFEKFTNEWLTAPTPAETKKPNYDHWSDKAKAIWLEKPTEEVEAYYINLCNYVVTLKKNPRYGRKNFSLIQKKKEWRNGLLEVIIEQNPNLAAKYKKLEEVRPNPGFKPLVALPKKQKLSPPIEPSPSSSATSAIDLTCNEELEDSD